MTFKQTAAIGLSVLMMGSHASWPLTVWALPTTFPPPDAIELIGPPAPGQANPSMPPTAVPLDATWALTPNPRLSLPTPAATTATTAVREPQAIQASSTQPNAYSPKTEQSADIHTLEARPLPPKALQQATLAVSTQPTTTISGSSQPAILLHKSATSLNKSATSLNNSPPLQRAMLESLTTSPGIADQSSTRGDVSILKSGIRQKLAHIDLPLNKAEVIQLTRPAARVSISKPEVASAVVLSPTQIQLVGNQVGVANLLIWGELDTSDHTAIDISVHRDVSTLIHQLRHVDPGIQIVPMAAEDTIILTGQAESRESAQLAIEMAKAFFSSTAAGAGASGGNTSSQAPGSAMPGVAPNVINLIKVKGEPSTKLELVRQRLGEIDAGIRIDVVPGPDGAEKVILTGRVANASIASRALNMASVFYGQPGIRMVTAQGGSDFARMQVSSTSNNLTTTVASGESAGMANLLQGSVLTDATGNVISMLEIAQKPQIKCSIRFLELSKNAIRALGGAVNGGIGNTMFSHLSGAQSALPGRGVVSASGGSNMNSSGAWDLARNRFNPTAQSVSGGFSQAIQNGATQILSINNQFHATLQALEEKRQVRTLAEPTLTLLSGEQGSFLAGGEVPIAFMGGQGQVSIQYHEFGIRLNLLPTVTDDGKIQMQVAPEVSNIDQSIAVLGVPGFTARRMQTTLIVEPGESFVLAGLFQQEETDSISRMPGIGSLPIIGNFFRNKWRDRRNNEMVVIIRPEIIYSHTGPTQSPFSAAKPPIDAHHQAFSSP